MKKFRIWLAVIGIVYLLSFLLISVIKSAGAGSICIVLSDGSGTHATLSDAYADAGCAQIELGAGTFFDSLSISRAVTIIGSGVDSTILDATGFSNALTVSAAGVVISDLTIQNANDYGLYLNSPGGVDADRLTIRWNDQDVGGGQGVFSYGTLNISHSQIYSHTNHGSGAGGIENYGNAELHHMVIFDNHSTTGRGGGVGQILGNMHIFDSEIYANSTGTYGAGITVFDGDLDVTRTSIYDNSSGGVGGIYFYYGQPTNSARIDSSAIYNNSGHNGAISIVEYPSIDITNSTISHNSGTFSGALYLSGTSLTMTHSTIVSNTAQQVGGISATRPGDSIHLYHSIIAQNHALSSSKDNCDGPMTVAVFNLVGHTGTADECSGFAPEDGNMVGTLAAPLYPGLAALGDYGGATWSHALLEESVAVDVVEPAGCPTHDQRGAIRPVAQDGSFGNCDIGAFEYGDVFYQLMLPASVVAEE